MSLSPIMHYEVWVDGQLAVITPGPDINAAKAFAPLFAVRGHEEIEVRDSNGLIAWTGTWEREDLP